MACARGTASDFYKTVKIPTGHIMHCMWGVHHSIFRSANQPETRNFTYLANWHSQTVIVCFTCGVNVVFKQKIICVDIVHIVCFPCVWLCFICVSFEFTLGLCVYFESMLLSSTWWTQNGFKSAQHEQQQQKMVKTHKHQFSGCPTDSPTATTLRLCNSLLRLCNSLPYSISTTRFWFHICPAGGVFVWDPRTWTPPEHSGTYGEKMGQAKTSLQRR